MCWVLDAEVYEQGAMQVQGPQQLQGSGPSAGTAHHRNVRLCDRAQAVQAENCDLGLSQVMARTWLRGVGAQWHLWPASVHTVMCLDYRGGCNKLTPSLGT